MTATPRNSAVTRDGSFPKRVPAPVTVAALVEAIGGVSQVVGEESVTIESVAALKDAQPGSLVFCRGTRPEEVAHSIASRPATVIVTEVPVDPGPGRCVVVVADPRGWFIRGLQYLFVTEQDAVIAPSAQISPDCEKGRRVSIGSGTSVAEGCAIGEGTQIGRNVVLGPGTRIGRGTLIQDNSVIGCVGLGYHITPEGARLFFPHLGAVLIGDNVVIGANCVVVRGMIDDTVIDDEARIGNLVNVGHNVRVGHGSVISSSATLVGGASLGKACNLAAGVTVNANIALGDGCQVGLGSVVTKSVAAGMSVFGVPAQPVRGMKRF